MKSEEITRSGRAARSRSTRARKSSRPWLRFISRSTWSEPLCTGRCRWFTSSGTSAKASIKAALKSSGWEVVKRMRSMPSTAAM